jgi:hypothetical protein
MKRLPGLFPRCPLFPACRNALVGSTAGTAEFYSYPGVGARACERAALLQSCWATACGQHMWGGEDARAERRDRLQDD